MYMEFRSVCSMFVYNKGKANTYIWNSGVSAQCLYTIKESQIHLYGIQECLLNVCIQWRKAKYMYMEFRSVCSMCVYNKGKKNTCICFIGKQLLLTSNMIYKLQNFKYKILTNRLLQYWRKELIRWQRYCATD